LYILYGCARARACVCVGVVCAHAFMNVSKNVKKVDFIFFYIKKKNFLRIKFKILNNRNSKLFENLRIW